MQPLQNDRNDQSYIHNLSDFEEMYYTITIRNRIVIVNARISDRSFIFMFDAEN